MFYVEQWTNKEFGKRWGNVSAETIEKSFCLIELRQNRIFLVHVIVFLEKHFWQPLPTRQFIYIWYTKFETKWHICKIKSPGSLSIYETKAEHTTLGAYTEISVSCHNKLKIFFMKVYTINVHIFNRYATVKFFRNWLH